MIYLTNLIKWRTLRSQMNFIINPNSQQYAEMKFEFQPDLMKVRINSTSLCFDLAYCLFAEIDFGVHMIRNGYD